MLSVLRVGDPHVKINNLADAEKLMQYVLFLAIERNVDRIELLGDLFHTHAIVRLEVMAFWMRWLDALSDVKETVVIVGNHDQTGDYNSNIHALMMWKRLNKPNLIIVDEPVKMGPFAYVPYIHHEEEFVSKANTLADQGAKILVSHSTYQGSTFENGMYAPDGFDQDKLKFDVIISGHIHLRQRFGKVIYPGTGKWDTNSDANAEKGLWLVTHDDNGSILSEEYLDTSKVVTPIFSIQWKEGDSEPEIPAGRVTMELIGTSDWIKKQKEKLKGKCGIKAKITDKVKERRKTSANLSDFILSNFTPIDGVSKEQISDYMKELNLV